MISAVEMVGEYDVSVEEDKVMIEPEIAGRVAKVGGGIVEFDPESTDELVGGTEFCPMAIVEQGAVSAGAWICSSLIWTIGWIQCSTSSVYSVSSFFSAELGVEVW